MGGWLAETRPDGPSISHRGRNACSAIGALGRIRTCDTRFRKNALYSGLWRPEIANGHRVFAFSRCGSVPVLSFGRATGLSAPQRTSQSMRRSSGVAGYGWSSRPRTGARSGSTLLSQCLVDHGAWTARRPPARSFGAEERLGPLTGGMRPGPITVKRLSTLSEFSVTQVAPWLRALSG